MSSLCLGQSDADFTFVKNTLHSSRNQTKAYIKLANAHVEDKSFKLYVIPFLFYKNYLSSQDFNVCNFSPSCSEYGLISVRKQGLVKGGLATFDRLTRCNPFSLRQYQFDTARQKFLDP